MRIFKLSAEKCDATQRSVAKSDKRQVTGYLAGFFALLTCPCHIPIYIMMLSGTAAGTLLADNYYIAAGVFSALFLFFIFSTMRFLKKR